MFYLLLVNGIITLLGDKQSCNNENKLLSGTFNKGLLLALQELYYSH